MRLALFVLATAIVFTVSASAQVIVFDNFDYADGNLVGNGSWAAHSGAGNSPVQVTGSAAVVQHGSGSREDVNLPFVAPVGNVYYGFDMTVTAGGAFGAGGYFIHLKNNTTTFRARVFLVSLVRGGDFAVGISSTGSSADGTIGNLDVGTTYRIVVRFDQISNQAELWIDPTQESDPSLLGIDGAGSTTVTQIALRQTNTSADERIEIDGLVVGTAFTDVLVPAPVELQSFTIE